MVKDNLIKCDYCGKEIFDEDAIYVEGRPYCKECHREAEIHADVEDRYESQDGEDYDEDDDDDDD
jgi:hypothetical protein